MDRPQTLVGLTILTLLAGGCARDFRAAGLAKSVAQARSLLYDPRLRKLAHNYRGEQEERLVEAFYSPGGQALWPGRQKRDENFNLGGPDQASGRIVYLTQPQAPWCVVLEANTSQHLVTLSGYGINLIKPIIIESALAIADGPESIIDTIKKSPPRSIGHKRKFKRMVIHHWGSGPDCVWRCLRAAGWSDAQIVRRRLVTQVSHSNGLRNPDRVEPGQKLTIPLNQSGGSSSGRTRGT